MRSNVYEIVSVNNTVYFTVGIDCICMHSCTYSIMVTGDVWVVFYFTYDVTAGNMYL